MMLMMMMEHFMKTFRMPYPLHRSNSATNADVKNKVRIQKVAQDFSIEHLMPVYELPMDESGRVIDASAAPVLLRHQSAFTHMLNQSELVALAQDPGNAHTVWLFALRSGEDDPVWINKFAQTAVSKESFRQYWDQHPMLVLAQLWVPPLGLAPTLVLMCSPVEGQTEIDGFEFDGQWDANVMGMNKAFPLFRLVDEGGELRRIRVEALDAHGQVLAATGQVLLSTTAGALSNSRPVLEQGAARVSLFGADTGAMVKIKLGFKWYSGVEQLEILI